MGLTSVVYGSLVPGRVDVESKYGVWTTNLHDIHGHVTARRLRIAREV